MNTTKNTQASPLKPMLTPLKHINNPTQGVRLDQANKNSLNQLWAGTFGNGGGKRKYSFTKRHRKRSNKKKKTKKSNKFRRRRKSNKLKIVRKKSKRNKTKKNIKKIYFGGTDQCNKKHSGDSVNDSRKILMARQPPIANIADVSGSLYGWNGLSNQQSPLQKSTQNSGNLLNAYSNTTNNLPMCED